MTADRDIEDTRQPAERESFECDNCHERHSLDDMETVFSRNLCHTCYEADEQWCYECGVLTPTQEMKNRRGNYYCELCAGDEE